VIIWWWSASLPALDLTEHVHEVVVVLRNRAILTRILNWLLEWLSDLREWDPELETFRAFKLACVEYAAALMRVTLGDSWVYQLNRVQKAQNRVWNFHKGCDNRSVSMEGELLDSCCDSCWKMMLPNPSQSRIVSGWASSILEGMLASIFDKITWCKALLCMMGLVLYITLASPQ